MMQNEKMSKRKVLYILLSVLIAAAVWAFVDEFGNNGGPFLVEQRIADIPIEYISEDTLTDRGLMLLKDGTSQTIDLTFRGARRLVTQLDRSKVRVTVDLSGASRPGVQGVGTSVSITDRKFLLNNNVTITDRSFYNATVNISELNSRTVEIRCEVTGNVAEGYSAGEVRLSQNTLEIRGLAKDIDPVSYAKVTLDIGKNTVETVTKDLSIQFYDRYNRLIENDDIYPLADSVQATLPVYVTKELKLVMDFLEAPGARVSNLDYTISPSTITVSGDAGKLKNVNTIVLGEFDLLKLLDEGASTNTYPIIIPDGCQNLSGVTRATMQIKFKDIASAEVVATQMEYAALPEGKEAEVLTEELMVSIFGTSEEVAAITTENLIVTADLTDYAAASGTYTVPATVSVKGTGDIGILGKYQVQVTIREPAPPEEEEQTPVEEE
ncbi:CdaR family protein [Oscillibacter sp.]|uniref:CdaR family protein n=1 Tax=Oscillibacter sp. TaxID=1945593 RepID=UPI001B661EF9|nr:CdaR family protein [Oscillibacter sp.]MBP3509940.1 hypothetical protein [Oscillibacter sp.]